MGRAKPIVSKTSLPSRAKGETERRTVFPGGSRIAGTHRHPPPGNAGIAR
jgi:hypothetical protein